MAYLGWIGATIHGQYPSLLRKNTPLENIIVLLVQFFKIHNPYSLNDKFKKMGILLTTWLNIKGENVLKQQGWKMSMY